MSDSGQEILKAERSAPGVYVARNGRGGEVRIGYPAQENSFTPGELLQAAFAACAALSADHVLSSRLGEDFDASVAVSAVANAEEERYEKIGAEFAIDVSELSPERQEAFLGRVEKTIEKLCTVGRTLSHGADARTEVTAQQL